MLGLKPCQVYKRKAKRTYYGWQDTGLSLPLSLSLTCSQIQLLSESAPTESRSAVKRLFESVVAIFFSELNPCS